MPVEQRGLLSGGAVEDPNVVLLEILKENPAMGKVFTPDDTKVIFADEKRQQLANEYMKSQGATMGGLEYWPEDESGVGEYTHPSPGKRVIEIFSQALRENPEELKRAIYGDLMHGMASDPTWKSMRDEFKNNFTAEEQQRIKKRQSWWEDAKGGNEMATTDAYIRGALNDPSAQKGQQESGGTMYSPKQVQILQDMQDYLKTGKQPNNGLLGQ